MTGNELTWRVVGYNTELQRNESHLYITDTKAQAYETCMKLNPTLDVYFVQRVDDYE